MSDTKLMRIMTKNGWRARLFGDKGETWKDTARDWLIALRSMGVHTQLQFTDRYGRISFTSTMRHGVNGCCFLNTQYSHEDYWDAVYLPVTADEEAKIWDEACKMAGVTNPAFKDEYKVTNFCYYGPSHIKYDFWQGAVFSYISKAKIIKPSKLRRVCNRAVTEAILAGKPDCMDTVIQTHRGREHRNADYASMTPSEADAMFRNFTRKG